MKTPKGRQGALQAPITSEDPFEELRDAFFARLRSDRVRLTTFAAALANALEEAAASASVAHADRSDASVWTALENLLDRLAIVNGERVLSAPVAKV
jgi:hypothetical protein